MIAFDVLILDSDGHPINQQERCLEIESYHSLLFPRFGKQQIKKYSPVLSIKPVIIEDNVWIGAKSIILKGVKIGKGAIIGAGSVVVGDVHPGTIVSGNPAKNIVSL
jgi:acetyltransferase-like isoleucine patch superfamily enzyme